MIRIKVYKSPIYDGTIVCAKYPLRLSLAGDGEDGMKNQERQEPISGLFRN